MTSTRIQQALQRATDTHTVTIGSGVLPAVSSVFQQHFGDRSAIVVADPVTWAVAGAAVQQHLRAAGLTVQPPFCFPDTPLHAGYGEVERLRAHLAASGAIPVAVGSGTINDLTKLAAHLVDRPYMVVATAASMDGYVAFGAAITRDGFKQTFACPAPRALVADSDILANAPRPMAAAGYADLLAKVSAGADWILADGLGIEVIVPDAWALVQTDLRPWIGQPEQLAAGDPGAAGTVLEGLVCSGVAMQLLQSSRVASGSEHQFSHLWEMEGLQHQGTEVSHGFKVGVGSLAIAALYDWLLDQDLTNLDSAALAAAWPTVAELEQIVRQAHPAPFLADKAVTMSLAKHLDRAALLDRLTAIRRAWPALRQRLRAQLMPASRVKAMLLAAGCPVSPLGIGLTLAAFKESFHRARQIRSRYTVLDLLFETGLLTRGVNAILGPDGFFAGL